MQTGVGLMVWSPKNCLCAGTAVERCIGTCGHLFISGGKKLEGSSCLCAKGSKIIALLLNTWCFHGKWDGKKWDGK
jgi:hypothetical protein